MTVPDLYRFSQQSLQDYVDCPRRFQLRYLVRQPWPTLPADSVGELRRHVQRGEAFHRLAHQYALGLEPGGISGTIQDPVLAGWWQALVQHPVPQLPTAVRRAEVSVGAPLANYRLAAKFDLLAAEPGSRLVVVDWKTATRRPPRATLGRRLQTRVYSYLAVEAGAVYNGGRTPSPDQVEMVYWFAASKGGIERFRYDGERHRDDAGYLASLVAEIDAQSLSIWPLTSDDQNCRWCSYQSLCEKDVERGSLSEFDGEPDLDLFELGLDLEQIAEIAF